MPPDLQVLLFGHFVSILLGTVEILRRAMWGLLRVEYEHICCHEKKMVGYEVDYRKSKALSRRPSGIKEALVMTTSGSPEESLESDEERVSGVRTTEGELISLLENITQTSVSHDND